MLFAATLPPVAVRVSPVTCSSVAAVAGGAGAEIEFVDRAHHDANDAICEPGRPVLDSVSQSTQAADDFPTGCEQQS